jgi:hypothetical protein
MSARNVACLEKKDADGVGDVSKAATMRIKPTSFDNYRRMFQYVFRRLDGNSER